MAFDTPETVRAFVLKHNLCESKATLLLKAGMRSAPLAMMFASELARNALGRHKREVTTGTRESPVTCHFGLEYVADAQSAKARKLESSARRVALGNVGPPLQELQLVTHNQSVSYAAQRERDKEIALTQCMALFKRPKAFQREAKTLKKPKRKAKVFAI